MALYYIDTSAAIKLIAQESHAEAMLGFYRSHAEEAWVSSNLLRIEITRAIARTRPALLPDARLLMRAFDYIEISGFVVEGAIGEPDPKLCSLDAIHLATARLLGTDLTALVSYDDRLTAAAQDAGMNVLSPGVEPP